MTEQTSSFGQLVFADASPQSFLLPSTAEMSRLDQNTIAHGTSGLELMEQAGAAVVTRITELFPSPVRCAVLCGPGNNGGDGLVIGRLLRERGFLVEIVLAASTRYSPECLIQVANAGQVRVFGENPTGLNHKFIELNQDELDELLGRSAFVVDALLGTGQRSAPRGSVKMLVERLCHVRDNGGRQVVVAVDIPTGLDADSGRLFEPYVRADHCITVQFIKRGMLQFPGRSACGVITTVAIGIAPESSVEFTMVNDISVPSIAPRPPDVHKGSLGKVLVVGGSLAMPGAPMLSALGALRAGAGIVTRVIRRSWHTAPALPEAMYLVLDGDADYFSERDVEQVLVGIRQHDVLVLGPGLGKNPDTAAFVHTLLDRLAEYSIALVVDADALNLLTGNAQSFARHRAVLTPHPGEAARLLGITSEQIQSDRFVAVRMLAEQYAATVVLKGAGTLVYEGSCGRLIAEGTPYLATPGSGDVLAGIIAACIPRSSSIYHAASLGAWIHAKAGVRAAQDRGGTILASDIAVAAGGLCT